MKKVLAGMVSIAILFSVIVTNFAGLATGTPVKKYIMFQMTNTTYDGIEAQLKRLKLTYGANNANSNVLYAFGIVGPMLLTQSPAEMTAIINKGFDLAQKYDIPVYFQMDDITNYTTVYGSGAEKWYLNDNMVEKYGFGTNALRAKFWYNWGAWKTSPAVPCLNSPEFISFVKNQIALGVTPVLSNRYNALKDAGKEYLFAGTSIGWETHIPDYTPGQAPYYINASQPPVSTEGVTMTQTEMGQTGYKALENLGYNDAKLTTEASQNGVTKANYIKQLLTNVQKSFTTMISKEIYDAGIPKTKIFTHILGLASYDTSINNTNVPKISTAVNSYSTPGFTMSPVTCNYNITVLKQLIAQSDPTQQYFGNVEGYAAGVKDTFQNAKNYFDEQFNNGALIVSVFGYTDMEDSLYGVPKDSFAPFNQAVLSYTNSTPATADNNLDKANNWLCGTGAALYDVDNGVKFSTSNAGYGNDSYIITMGKYDPKNIKFDFHFENIANMIGQDSWIVIQLTAKQYKFAISGGYKENTGYGLMIRPGQTDNIYQLVGFNSNGGLDTYGQVSYPISADGKYTFMVTTPTGSTNPEIYINGTKLIFSGSIQLSNIVGLAGTQAYLGTVLNNSAGGNATLRIGKFIKATADPVILSVSSSNVNVTDKTSVCYPTDLSSTKLNLKIHNYAGTTSGITNFINGSFNGYLDGVAVTEQYLSVKVLDSNNDGYIFNIIKTGGLLARIRAIQVNSGSYTILGETGNLALTADPASTTTTRLFPFTFENGTVYFYNNILMVSGTGMLQNLPLLKNGTLKNVTFELHSLNSSYTCKLSASVRDIEKIPVIPSTNENLYKGQDITSPADEQAIDYTSSTLINGVANVTLFDGTTKPIKEVGLVYSTDVVINTTLTSYFGMGFWIKNGAQNVRFRAMYGDSLKTVLVQKWNNGQSIPNGDQYAHSAVLTAGKTVNITTVLRSTNFSVWLDGVLVVDKYPIENIGTPIYAPYFCNVNVQYTNQSLKYLDRTFLPAYYDYNVSAAKIISGVSEKMSSPLFLQGIHFGYGAYANLKNMNGTYVGTGVTVAVNNGTQTVNYTVLIKGDTDGDGDITISDLAKIKLKLLNSGSLSGIYLTAGDINEDSKITISDLIGTKKHLLGLFEINQ